MELEKEGNRGGKRNGVEDDDSDEDAADGDLSRDVKDMSLKESRNGNVGASNDPERRMAEVFVRWLSDVFERDME